MKRSFFTRRRLHFGVVACSVAFVVYDYVTYHSRYNAAMEVVSRHDGRAGSLLDWPFGRHCRITFTRPLTDEALDELSVLNSLSGRHWVGVAFDCEISDAEFQAARDALYECGVFRVSRVSSN